MTQKKGQKGFSLVELLIVVAIIGIVAAIAIPNLLASRRAANEGSAISSLRTINSAEATYQSSTGNGDFGTLQELRTAQLVDAQLGAATPQKSGYNFALEENPQTFAATGAVLTLPDYTATANPITPDAGATQTGTRKFGTSEAGVIVTSTAALDTALARAAIIAPNGTTVKPIGN